MTMACEPKWCRPRMNQPKFICVLMYQTLPQAVELDGL